MTFSIETVCTDADLAAEIGGTGALANIIPLEYAGVATIARTAILAEVMRSLSRRTPPIYEENFQDPAELKAVVVAGTLEKLYRVSMTTPDGIFALQRKIYADRYSEELRGLMPLTTTGDGSGRMASLSFSVERR